MGIYSTNRFSNLTATLEENSIVIENDDQEIEVSPEEIPEIDDDVLAMLGDDEDEPSVDLDEAMEYLDSIVI